MRPGDPLDTQTGVPAAPQTHRLKPGIVREHKEIYVRGYIAGLAAPLRRRRARFAWAAVILATTALVLTAFWAGHVTAAPRPAAVIPADDHWGLSSPDQQRTGAPESDGATTTAPGAPFDPSSFPPVGFGVANPSDRLGDASSGTNPAYTPEPERTPPATRAVSRGTGPGIGGLATWFAVAPYGTAAAGPRLRRYLGADWRGSRVSVSLRGCGCPPVVLVLTDWCACTPPNGPDRLIDLDDQAFAALAPLTAGVITVEVREVAP